MKSPGGGFFHIDRRIWRLLCDRGDINMAVSYLTIATGTGAGNLRSSWSAKSIEKYLGLHNSRATEAITQLIGEGFALRGEESTRTGPVYEIQPYAAAVEALQAAGGEPSLLVLSSIRRNGKLAKRSLPIADRLVAAGLLWRNGPGFSLEPPPAAIGGELIWLPNTLVTGTQRGEPSPVKRLRSCGDIWALRLLIDLYHAQNLSADGGISRRVLATKFERKRYGQRGRRVIWGFMMGKSTAECHPTIEAFWKTESNKIWDAISTLRRFGLLSEVPHLMENSRMDCEPIHAFGWDGLGEQLEQELGTAADEAGRHMLGSMAFSADPICVGDNGAEMLAPVWDTQTDVQMVGIYRLTYRPQTRLTADWLRRMNEKSAEWLEEYKNLCPQTIVFSQVS